MKDQADPRPSLCGCADAQRWRALADLVTALDHRGGRMADDDIESVAADALRRVPKLATDLAAARSLLADIAEDLDEMVEYAKTVGNTRDTGGLADLLARIRALETM